MLGIMYTHTHFNAGPPACNFRMHRLLLASPGLKHILIPVGFAQTAAVEGITPCFLADCFYSVCSLIFTPSCWTGGNARDFFHRANRSKCEFTCDFQLGGCLVAYIGAPLAPPCAFKAVTLRFFKISWKLMSPNACRRRGRSPSWRLGKSAFWRLDDGFSLCCWTFCRAGARTAPRGSHFQLLFPPSFLTGTFRLMYRELVEGWPCPPLIYKYITCIRCVSSF